MSLKYQGTKGTIYDAVEPALGHGGEGTVYRIKGKPDRVLKIFRDDKRTEMRHKKLRAMIDINPDKNILDQVTWPIDVVYDIKGFAGYVMPVVTDGDNLNVVYSDSYKATQEEKIHIAMNLCAAINSVHNIGQVCGDLNPANIKVYPNGRVKLIDADSYHIVDKKSGRTYRCEVGIPEYIPHEVQLKMKGGADLKTAPLPTYTVDTDNFALAVHIFALLMHGCHPFACAADNSSAGIGNLSRNQNSIVCPQPIDNICCGFFPFYNKSLSLTTPVYAPSVQVLTPEIMTLFVQAFCDGYKNPSNRPTPVQWYAALEKMRRTLTICKRNKAHMYPSNLSYCPWCELEKKMNNYQLPPQRSSGYATAQQPLKKTINVAPNTNASNSINNTVPISHTIIQTGVKPKKSHNLVSIAVGMAVLIIILYILIRPMTQLNNKASTVENADQQTTQQTDQAPAPEITAFVTDAEPEDLNNYLNIGIASADASSELVQDSVKYNNSAIKAADGDPVTSWQEGAEGDGTGQSLTAYLANTVNIQYIDLKLGNWRSDSLYNKNNRPSVLTVNINDKSYELDFTDAKIDHYIEFSSPVTASAISFTVQSVYKGSAYNDCCISEISVYGTN